MSYDLMVFNPHAAPKKRNEFLQWYQKQVEWSEDPSYDDPAETSPELRGWFIEMIETFPAMNGPYSNEAAESERAADYTIARNAIYASFPWSAADKAYELVIELAAKYGAGFYDVSGEDGDLCFPAAGGDWEIIEYPKPWWKFW